MHFSFLQEFSVEGGERVPQNVATEGAGTREAEDDQGKGAYAQGRDEAKAGGGEDGRRGATQTKGGEREKVVRRPNGAGIHQSYFFLLFGDWLMVVLCRSRTHERSRR